MYSMITKYTLEHELCPSVLYPYYNTDTYKPIGCMGTCGSTHEIVFMLARPNFTSIDLQNTTPNGSLRGWVGGWVGLRLDLTGC